ncbi:MAG: hypothetical protein QF903_14900 [Planctomycetota bacterium]|jgi:hypothetical protein|nr:hypothetical protein [Planctomycetota bacterium]MDP6990758.1 hypothetical protein [Planctomycetota bacterium]
MALITRRIGRIVRGKATPFQLIAATVLTAELVFVPELSRAPGLAVVLGALLLCVNANLGLALLLAAPLRLAALALMPVSFAAGRLLLDGPTRGLFERAVDAPGLAWCGLDHYATSGGLAVGAAVGLLTGGALARALGGLRRRLASLESGSDAYRRLTARPLVRLGLFLFVGGSRGNLAWEELASRRIGNPIRPAGAVLVVLLGGGAFAAQSALGEALVTGELRRGLGRLNGATVDLEGASLDLAGGSLTLRGLALADPDALDRDLFRAETLDVDCSARDLLRRRLRIERVVVAGASQGERRERVGERLAPPAPAAEDDPGSDAAGPAGLEDYLGDAEAWRERLTTLRRWLEELAPREGAERAAEATEPAGGAPGTGETLAERLEREVAARGYAAVRAPHLRREAPAVHVSELVVEDLRLAALDGRALRVVARDLSTHPDRLAQAPRLDAASAEGDLDLELELDLAAPAGGEGAGRVFFAWRSIPAERVTAALDPEDGPTLTGGTVDLVLDGTWSPRGVGSVDLPLEIVLRDSVVRLGGEQAPLERLALAVGLSGPLDALAIDVDREALAESLTAAGAQALAGALRAEVDAAVAEAREEVDEAVGQAREELREEVDEAAGELREELDERAGELFDGLLDGKRKGLLQRSTPGGSRLGGRRSKRSEDGR